MRNPVKLLALALTLPAAAALASGTAVSSETEAKLQELLTGQGYEVTEIEAENGMFEAEATKDGKEYEFTLNDRLEIVKIDEDSEDDD
ncbi:PepSY domain-containing protein [Leisingera aquimarina]|uniref:PepSY domain-containing protein n=1 Tax=Leisingera aquimarina TaxID=476529 RepID=UPI000484A400|nr:PepSY domain-containing protein [Leisingera aquimarina]